MEEHIQTSVIIITEDNKTSLVAQMIIKVNQKLSNRR